MSGPYAVVLRFRAGQPLSSPVPEAIHAAFLGLVRRADPALFAALHAPNHRVRPYTLALLGPREGLELRLRVSVLCPDLFLRFWERWERQGGIPLRLGRTWLAPQGIEAKGPWAGEIHWTNFEELPPVQRVALAFATPTTFRQGDVDIPLPIPRLLFSGLLTKWNAAAPRPLDLDGESISRYIAVRKAHIHTKAFWDGRTRIWGFVGCVEFQLKRDAPQALRRALAILSAFSPYAGAGRRTTHGMGLVRLLYAA